MSAFCEAPGYHYIIPAYIYETLFRHREKDNSCLSKYYDDYKTAIDDMKYALHIISFYKNYENLKEGEA